MAMHDVGVYKPIGNAPCFVRDTGEDEEALCVYGELDMASEADLTKAIEDVAKANKPILIDLTYCTYVDSRTIHVLQKASLKWKARVLAAAGSIVQRVCEIVNASQFMDITYQDVPKLEARTKDKKKAGS